MTEYQRRQREELKQRNQARHKLERTTKRVGYKPPKKGDAQRKRKAKISASLDTIPNGVWTEATKTARAQHNIITPKVHALEPLWYIDPKMPFTLCGKMDRELKVHHQLDKITCSTCKRKLTKVGL